MGACTFINSARRKNHKDAASAFQSLVSQSQYESGRSYSGEIGMKSSFKRAVTARSCASMQAAIEEAERLLDEEADRYFDKWGPAYSIEVEGPEGGWVFFGWASS